MLACSSEETLGISSCAFFPLHPTPRDFRRNPEGLSYEELKKLAVLGTPEALDKLRQALEAHEKRLEDMKQSKTGRNALVGAQRKRIGFIQDLLAASSQYRQVQEGS